MGPPDAEARPALAGQTVGNYRILELIGRGGMGEVYKAWDERLRRTVAVKTLSTRLGADRISRKRFLRETRVACRVEHPYIATVFDVVEHGDDLLMVMQYIEGRRFDQVIRDDRPGLRETNRLALEIAEALTAIHDVGIVHRDLKPSNVMVTPGGHVKVMDFGLARPTGFGLAEGDDTTVDSLTSTITREGFGIGTLRYMSPEQLQGQQVDLRSDLFSFGIVLYEAVTNSHPFHRDSAAATASAILKDPPGGGTEPVSLSESGPTRQVVLRLLEKDPANRYPDARSLVEDLRAVNEGIRLPRRPRAMAARRTRRIAGLAAVAVALAAAAVALWAGLKPGGPAPVLEPRPVIAVLPFEDRTGRDSPRLRGEMLAGLMAASLDAGGRLRPLGAERVRGILEGLGPMPTAGEVLEALSVTARVDWVAAGILYEQDGHFHATIDVHASGAGDPVHTIRASAGGTAALVDAAAVALVDRLDPQAAGSGSPPVSAGRLSSESEAARLLEQGAREALRQYRYTDAIHDLDRALEIDPRFLSARTLHAEALHGAGFGRRARESGEEALRQATGPGGPPTERMGLEARALHARILENLADEEAIRRSLADRFPDDPEVLMAHGHALWLDARHERALTVAERARDLDGLDPRAHLLLARIRNSLGRHDEADESLTTAERLFEILKAPAGLARCAEARGHLLRRRGEYEAAAPFHRKAADIYRSAGYDVLAAIAESNAADMELLQGRLSVAQSGYESALSVARSAGNFRLVVDDLYSLGAALFQNGEFEQAEQYLRESLSDARRVENPALVLPPLVNLASLTNYTGRLGESRGLADEAISIARDRADRKNEVKAMTILADSVFQQGRLAEAAATYEDLIRLEEARDPSSSDIAWAKHGLALARDASGSLGPALESIEAAVAVGDAEDRWDVRVYSRIDRALLRGRLGLFQRAEEDLATAGAVAKAVGREHPDVLPRLAMVRGRLAAMRGDWGEAEAHLNEVLAVDRNQNAKDLGIPSLIAASMVSRAQGRPGDAVRLARRALEAPRASAIERTMARNALARALVAQGDRAGGARAARHALDEAGVMGAPLEIARAAAVLVSLPPEHRPVDAEEIRSRGEAALDAVVASMPEERRAGFRARRDLEDVVKTLRAASADES